MPTWIPVSFPPMLADSAKQQLDSAKSKRVHVNSRGCTQHHDALCVPERAQQAAPASCVLGVVIVTVADHDAANQAVYGQDVANQAVADPDVRVTHMLDRDTHQLGSAVTPAPDEAIKAARQALNDVGEPSGSEALVPLVDKADKTVTSAGDEDDNEPDYDDSIDLDHVAVSSVDVFGLDRDTEQKNTPWIQALVANLEHGALTLNGQLRVKALQILFATVCY
ncbi:unnamed protein product [Phytophthora fragariaefolia]|uniref:Unnamed protein product n=1 Tax=Phytophthora fragariaefolia TaxID=1490495 RepID=A0A9W6WRI1_9STRA|nr:unnamed protein product [Phytophthora fragariaefolia]